MQNHHLDVARLWAETIKKSWNKQDFSAAVAAAQIGCLEAAISRAGMANVRLNREADV